MKIKDVVTSANDVHEKHKYQVAAFVSGDSKQDIVEQLQTMIDEIKAHRGDDGYPLQGVRISSNGVLEVVRPTWGKYTCN